MKIGVIIVEDDQRDIQYLSSCLQSMPIVSWIQCARDVASAVCLIDSYKPDLVYLDVKLPDGMGFDVLEQCSYKSFSVVFTTSYEHYALKAIKFSAIDFLLKPFNYDEIFYSLEKAKSLSEPNSKILVNNLSGLSEQEKRIGISSSKGINYLKLGDIIRCEANGNYTIFVMKDGTQQVSSRPLKDYEDLLGEFSFLRIHKSYLINLNYVKSFIRNDGGFITMSDDLELPISKAKKDEFLERMKTIN
jgi:two-component system, LytTR family, response regulator